jgi:hypothetical protein
MTTTINGQETRVSVCREWGALLLPGRMIVLGQYPLQQLNNIDVPPMDPATAAALAQAEPVTEQRQVTAKYRVTKKDGDSRISFAPVQRVHQLDTGEVTELGDININLNEKLRQDLGGMNVGDEKEFSMMVTVLTGYRLPGPLPTGATG